MIETKEQFMERYTIYWSDWGDIFETKVVAMPCDCEDGGGPTHWAAVRRDPCLIRHHLEFCAPEGTPWPEGIPKSREKSA